MIGVTAGTNIYISAQLFGGLPGPFLDLALLQLFVASPALVATPL